MGHSMAITAAHETILDLAEGECWWGGAVADGQRMPFGRAALRRNLATSAGLLTNDQDGANQSAPFLISNRGRYIWSEDAFSFEFVDGTLGVTGGHPVVGAGPEPTLASAFRVASRTHFPPTGATPAAAMFLSPQYNTWMEMPYEPTQDGVLSYVRGLLDSGLPPGLVIIDDNWSPAYGTWQFDVSRFPDPTSMVRTLHAWGCPVMLWIVPFVSPDTHRFRDLEKNDLLVRNADGSTAIRHWWNGFSAVLDVSNPAAAAGLCEDLDCLVSEHGIDGFKFDAGDLRDFRSGDRNAAMAEPTEQCEAWARIARRYRFNELRACWKMGGQPLAQRLHDKPPLWGARGLLSLVPECIAQGLIGHPFVCPDMVGGGDVNYCSADRPVDQELFVRYAQCAALFPMMQFSMAPARVLDADHLHAVQAAVRLRQSLANEILDLVNEAATSGEPILRPLAYHFSGYEHVHDQFLLGERILVAPVLRQRASTRSVEVPPGNWIDGDGHSFTGPDTVELPVGLESIPWFRRG